MSIPSYMIYQQCHPRVICIVTIQSSPVTTLLSSKLSKTPTNCNTRTYSKVRTGPNGNRQSGCSSTSIKDNFFLGTHVQYCMVVLSEDRQYHKQKHDALVTVLHDLDRPTRWTTLTPRVWIRTWPVCFTLTLHSKVTLLQVPMQAMPLARHPDPNNNNSFA